MVDAIRSQAMAGTIDARGGINRRPMAYRNAADRPASPVVASRAASIDGPNSQTHPVLARWKTGP